MKINKRHWRAVAITIALTWIQNAYALKIYVTGDAANVSPATQATLCLAGGGSDDSWAGGWKYFLQRSGGGDVVIIRTDGKRGGYEPWIYSDTGGYGFPAVNSVTTISIKAASEANDSNVEALVRDAEAVFFAGGDQSLYINWFRGSKLESAVEYLINTKHAPVGGTSAGMALLADIDFKAEFSPPGGGNVDSQDAMLDPTATFIDLDRTVINPPSMTNVITDTHFAARDRFGRLLSFMARATYNYADLNYSTIKAIAADEGTAVCFNENNNGTVFGAAYVYFLRGNTPVERIQSGTSLHWYGNRQAVSAYHILGSVTGSGSFNLSNWSGSGGSIHYWWVNGSNSSAPVFGMD